MILARRTKKFSAHPNARQNKNGDVSNARKQTLFNSEQVNAREFGAQGGGLSRLSSASLKEYFKS